MRGILFLVSTVVLAQVTPATKPPSVSAKPRPSATTSTAAQKTTSSTSKPAAAAKNPPPVNTATMTDEQKTIYALGLSIARSLSQFELSPAELEIVKRAMSDSAAGKPAVQLETWGPKIRELGQGRAQKTAELQKEASATYLAKAATEPGVVKTESGLIYKEIVAGTGASPKPTDTVKVNYRGTLVNGKEFDSSAVHGGPAELALNRVIPCWTEGVQKMKVGGKARLVCPSQIAYRDQGQGEIPGGAALIFEIELLGISGGTTPQ